jgi:cation-transporting ATPase 13A2
MVEAQRFEPIKYDIYKSFNQLLAIQNQPLNENQRKFARVLYGPGEIVVPGANIFLLFIDELLNPFYIFQIFALGIWYWEAYTLFAAVLTVLSGLAIISAVYDRWASNSRVRKLAKYTCEVEILQNDTTFKVCDSSELLPGDVIRVPTGMPLPVDLIQISGISIANEALLTGESIPVIKSQLPKSEDEFYNDDRSKYTLYAGTTVI